MPRLPRPAASRNMSACSAQAMSQVGCRLMVASSANTSRPRAPEASGDIARALATKAAISSEAAGFASGKEPALPDAACCAADTSPWDFGLVGSPDISARKIVASSMWAGMGHDRVACLDRLLRALVIEEFVEHALDRCLCLVRTGIAHVVVLVAGLHNGNPGLLTDFLIGNDTGIGLEHRILRTERQDLESAVGHERHTQVVQRHDLLDMVGVHLGEV